MGRAGNRTALIVSCLGLIFGQPAASLAERSLTISSTSTLTSDNPYAESESQMYTIWCQVYGCLGRLDYISREWKPMLAEKWEVVDGVKWRFTLRQDIKRHDGGPPPKPADVIHSWKRIMADPAGAQRYMFADVTDIVEVDDRTVDIITKEPTGQLHTVLFSQFAITSAELSKEHGRDADRAHSAGWGPYKLKSFTADQQIALQKSDVWSPPVPDAPDTVIYRQMREPEQRVTALLTNEIQVARLVPPQLVERLKTRSDVKVVPSRSVELMFLAFSPVAKPWDNPLVRRAAAHAVNRDAIINRLLFGYADALDGPLGPSQLCHTGPAPSAAKFDQAKARALLAEAGYKNGGPEIDFYTSTGRYISDRQISEAIAQMLTQVGFKVRLHTPEWANLWSDVRNGKVPMYYMGRGQVADPAIPLSQYFETGVSPRIKYSSAEVDGLFKKIRASFNENERCGLIREVAEKLAADVPAHFLWTHQLINGVRANIDYPADPSGEPWLVDVKMK